MMTESFPPRIAFAVAHAAFDPVRRELFRPLRLSLEMQCKKRDVPFFVAEDRDRSGSLRPWLDACEWALAEPNITHFCFLPDDAIVVPNFIDVMHHLVEARPNDLLCMLSNHGDAPILFASTNKERDALMGAKFVELQTKIRDAFQADDRLAKLLYTRFGERYEPMRTRFQGLGDGAFRWYATSEGSCFFGGVMPILDLHDHLIWRKKCLHPAASVANDEGLNMWALHVGKTIYKPLPSPCDHSEEIPSLDGNDHQKGFVARRSLVYVHDFDFLGTDFSVAPDNDQTFDLGRSYLGNHWNALFKVRSESLTPDVIENVYAAQRNDRPMRHRNPLDKGYVDATRALIEAATLKGGDGYTVTIATPCYGPIAVKSINTRREMIADLERHGFTVQDMFSEGASFIPIARNFFLHQFLATRSNGILFVDADIEVINARAFRRMLMTGHPVIGLAYPLRDGSGRVAGNMLLEQDITSPDMHPAHDSVPFDVVNAKMRQLDYWKPYIKGRPTEPLAKSDPDMTMSVRDLGTGYLYIARDAVVKLLASYPEILYAQDGWMAEQENQPAWALFDGLLEKHLYLPWTRRYMTEDYTFCKRWRMIGGEVRCYLPPQVRHWGVKAAEGDVMKAWKLIPESPQALGLSPQALGLSPQAQENGAST